MKLSEIVGRVSIDPRKLIEYALNLEAPWGQHKAVVFERLLGITRQNYAGLVAQIEQQVLAAEAILHGEDRFGRRYTVDLTVSGTEGRQAVVRTGWIVPHGAHEARLVTLYLRR
jgi:hypothetical protein